MSTVSSAEGGRIRAVVPSQRRSALTRPPVRAFRHGCSGEISSLRFEAFFTVKGSVSRRSRVFRSSRGNSVVEPIRSPNYGNLQALGLCRRENTTLFREAVDASAIRTVRRATAPSGRRGRRQDPGDHRRRAQQHPSSISFSWNACSYCYSPRQWSRVAIPSLQASRCCTLARTFVSPPRVIGRVGVLGGTAACS
jgi:hypothetical protein